MTDWRTHQFTIKGKGYSASVIFRVCLVSKITKESHSKIEMFKSSPFKASPVVHISFIATLQADVDHGPGKIQGWLFFFNDWARWRRHIFEKSQQNLSFQTVSIVKLNFKVGLFSYIFLFEFIFVSFFLRLYLPPFTREKYPNKAQKITKIEI